MQPAKINYKIYQGSTFQEIFRWESEYKVYQPIVSIEKSAPCKLVLQDTPLLPQGWRFRVVGAGGMKEINSAGDSFYLATSVGIATKQVEVNAVNSLNYTTYTTGGVLEYNQPVDLSSYSARMQIRKTLNSEEVLHTATTANGGIVLDNLLKTITVNIPASITTEFKFLSGVYSIELFDAQGIVVPFLVGNITVVPEITR